MDVSIKLFSLSVVPPVARNPGDATGRMQQHAWQGRIQAGLHSLPEDCQKWGNEHLEALGVSLKL